MQMTKPKKDFSFRDHAAVFDRHIALSIPGYRDVLSPECVRQSHRFVQPGTHVYDVGCSSGHLLDRVRRANQVARPDVRYIGIDCELGFEMDWTRKKRANLHFELADARRYQYRNASLIFSRFTIQFIREADKRSVLKRLYNGLVDGGALIIAEKTLAETARLQDALTGPYYDHKREKGFTAEQILDKERSLRGQMTLWTEAELREELGRAGFREMNAFWRASSFVAYLALK
jgi:tRNA (cmo5U34)-methyltransferase